MAKKVFLRCVHFPVVYSWNELQFCPSYDSEPAAVDVFVEMNILRNWQTIFVEMNISITSWPFATLVGII